MSAVVHGGTDAGPAPRLDASTNASPYGPSPVALAALRAPVGPYPDPTASATVAALAAHHGIDPSAVVVGAGATELLDRVVRVVGGPVLVGSPTFGEYAGAAARHDVPVRSVPEDRWVDPAVLAGAALAFVASPGNPDGRVRDAAWCDAVARAAAAAGTTLVWDLAYAPMVDRAVPVPAGAVAVHAPNKAHGCTGLRAGWCTAPAPLAARLRAAAVTWCVSTPGLAFLAGTACAAADAWVAEHRVLLLAQRELLAADLRAAGLEVVHGDAPFVLVDAAGPDDPDPTAAAERLAAELRTRHGVRVRPTASQGLPGWWRVAAVRPEDHDLLVTALTTVLADRRGERSEP